MANVQHLQQPRLCRVRVFAPDGEIEAKQTYLVVLDLTPGPALARTKSQLDNLLDSFAALDNPAKSTSGYYLTVTDVGTDETFKWLAH